MRTLLFFCLASLAPAATIELDTATTLLDSSSFTTGATYVAAFQLTAAGFANTQAALSMFQLDGGTGLPISPSDLTAGLFTVGPFPALTSGIWQSNGTLDLNVDPVNAYSLYTQSFTAGAAFRFDVLLTTTLPDLLLTPDQFSFQLYDSNFSTLLYDTALDAIPAQSVPEPSTFYLMLPLALSAVPRLLRRRPGNGGSRATGPLRNSR